MFIKSTVFPFKVSLLCIFLTGCNLYNSLDKPSGDTQILSAARACFDRGDFTCSANYYNQLSSSLSDQANSETAFEILAQNGSGSSVFMDSVLSGTTNGGKLVTTLAEYLTATASQSTRMALFRAYQKTLLISDTKTQGLIRFITATALLSEVLAEDAGQLGKLTQSDLVTNPTTCLASAPLYNSPSCGVPTGKKITTGTNTFSLPTATDSNISGSPTLILINAAFSEINAGLSQLGATGSIGSSAQSLATIFTAQPNLLSPGSQDSPAYRALLISNGIGEAK